MTQQERSSVDRDRATLEAIGLIYCQAHHDEDPKDQGGLCGSCREAVEVTLQKAEACPHGHSINCEQCAIKCQRGEGQKRIKEIMRYSAPRMIFWHPIMTFGYVKKRIASKRADQRTVSHDPRSRR